MTDAAAIMFRALPLAALLFAAGCGCSGDGGAEAPAAPSADPVEDRMHDPDYLAALKKQETGQKEAMKAIARAREALAAAEAAGSDAAELASLSNAVKEAVGALEKNRAESREIVRRQISKGFAEKDRLKAEQQKKEK